MAPMRKWQFQIGHRIWYICPSALVAALLLLAGDSCLPPIDQHPNHPWRKMTQDCHLSDDIPGLTVAAIGDVNVDVDEGNCNDHNDRDNPALI
jgi:hypothetical protein